MRYCILLLFLLFFSTAKAQEDEYVRVPLEVALRDTNFKKVVDIFDHTVWTLDKGCAGDSCVYGNDSSYFIIASWIPTSRRDTIFRVGYCDSIYYEYDSEENTRRIASRVHKPGLALIKLISTNPITYTALYGTNGVTVCTFSLIHDKRFSLTFSLDNGNQVTYYYKPVIPDEAAMDRINYSFEHLMK